MYHIIDVDVRKCDGLSLCENHLLSFKNSKWKNCNVVSNFRCGGRKVMHLNCLCMDINKTYFYSLLCSFEIR